MSAALASQLAHRTVRGTNWQKGADMTAIVLTEAASERLRSLLADEKAEGMALRVGVRSGGCSGFTYDLHFDSEVADDDLQLEFSGVRVVIDATSAPLLEGATLDFTSGLNGEGFRLSNPNAKRQCGCGKSFS